MPISALPQETVRLLGSPLVFSSPVAVVKELVDNAIDANSTSVEVFVALNTVDSLEVRDNGHGIHPDDFATLGRRGCTSKLRTFEDIQTVGAITLGFRGEALACATTISTLHIVTRTAGEPTASKLSFSEAGGVGKIERVAAPVGTAVKVTDLFAKIPVRKQWALKEATKSLSIIKDLLHTYAFARPHVKLALKVLDQPKLSWSYAPGSHPSIKQAALQIFGTELVSQSIAKTNKIQDATPSSSNDLAGIFRAQEKDVYAIDAVLPQPGANPTRISRGPWFSVDSRPVSASKGTIKALYSTFRTHLNRTLELPGSTTSVRNPFVAVNIKCPPRSYDPNVETSKDEVLFADSPRLIEAFERLLENVYSTTPPDSSPSASQDAQLAAKLPHQNSEAVKPQDQSSHLISPDSTPDDSPPSPVITGAKTSVISGVSSLTKPSQLRPQQHPTSPRMTVSDINRLEEHSLYITPPSSHDPKLRAKPDLLKSSTIGPQDDRTPQISRRWKVDMSSHGENDDEPIAITSQHHSQEQEAERNQGFTKASQDVNPWVIAKFNARRSQDGALMSQAKHQTRTAQDSLPITAFEVNARRASPIPRLRPVVRLDSDGASGKQVLAPMPAPHLRAPGLSPGVSGSPISNLTASDSEAAQRVRRQAGVSQEPQGSNAHFRHGNRAYRNPRGSTRQHSPSDDQSNDWFQGSLDFTTRKRGRLSKERSGSGDRLDVQGAGRTQLSKDEPNADLDLGAIRRRQALAETRRLRETRGGRLNSSAELEDSEAVVSSRKVREQDPQVHRDMPKDEVVAKTGFPCGDSRAYLLAKESSLPATTTRRLRRVKSCMLPLETTPAGEETHNLVQTLQIDMQELCRSFEQSHYVLEGSADNVLGQPISQTESKDIEHCVRGLLSKMELDELDSSCQVEFNIPQVSQVEARPTSARS